MQERLKVPGPITPFPVKCYLWESRVGIKLTPEHPGKEKQYNVPQKNRTALYALLLCLKEHPKRRPSMATQRKPYSADFKARVASRQRA